MTEANLPEMNRLMRTVDKWWNEVETLIVTGATTAKVEANNTTIKNIKRIARGYWNRGELPVGYPVDQCRGNRGMTTNFRAKFPKNRG